MIALFLVACGNDYFVMVDKDAYGGGSWSPEDGYVVDQFTVRRQKLDIFLAIDRSGSMKYERETLATNVDSFIDVLESDLYDELDWRVSVGDVDASNGASELVVYYDDEDPASALKEKVTENGTGVSVEGGLSEAMLSMVADGYHRDDADLMIIIMTDEEDQSVTTPTAFNLYAETYKSDPFTVTVGGIMYTDTSWCASDFDDGYDEVYSVAWDMCSPETWYEAFEYPAEHMDYLDRAFKLSNVPDETTLRVFVDGVEAFSAWEYDWQLVEVRFGDGIDLEPDTRVNVIYMPLD